MRRTIPGFITSLFLGTTAVAQTLPEGEGREAVANTCNQCHELGLVTDKRLTQEQWQYVVTMMISLGAPIPDDQMDVILAYLTKNFGPSSGVGEQ